MHYLRRRPQVAPTGRITLKLTTAQRGAYVRHPETPKDLGHLLHRAPVHNGKLQVRVTRQTLDTLITVAATFATPDRQSARELSTFLTYLESFETRFADPELEETGGK